MDVKKKHMVLHDPIFHQRVDVFLNYSYAAWAAWVKKCGCITKDDGRDVDAQFNGFSTSIDIPGKPRSWVICLKEFSWTIQEQNTLIHEIVHTVIKIWDFNNIPVSGQTQEFFAHSVGNMYEDIAKRLVPHKGRGYRMVQTGESEKDKGKAAAASAGTPSAT